MEEKEGRQSVKAGDKDYLEELEKEMKRPDFWKVL